MKKLVFACALALLLAGFSVPSDLGRFVPPDSQVVMEVGNFNTLWSVAKDFGLGAKLLEGTKTLDFKGLGSAEITLNSQDLDDLANSSLSVGARFYDPATGRFSLGGILAVRLSTTALFEKVTAVVKALVKSAPPPATNGGFTCYSLPLVVLNTAVVVAFGENCLLFGSADDVRLAVSETREYPWPASPTEGGPVPAGDPLFRFMVRGGRFGNWPDKLAEAVSSLLKDFVPENGKEARPAGKKVDPAPVDKGKQSDALPFLASFTPEKVKAFVAGLGLGQVRDVCYGIWQEGDVLKLHSFMTMEDGKSLVNDYYKGAKALKVAGYEYISDDVASAVDFVADLPGFYRLLRQTAVSAFGNQAEMLFLPLEILAGSTLGMSLTDEILPMVGGELGFVNVDAAFDPSNPMDVLKSFVFFCVPKDIALLEKAMAACEKNLELKVDRTPVAKGGPVMYRLGAKNAAPDGAGVYVFPVGKALLVSVNPEALKRMGERHAAGRTLAQVSEIKNAVARAKGDVALLSYANVTPQIVAKFSGAFSTQSPEIAAVFKKDAYMKGGVMVMTASNFGLGVVLAGEIPVSYARTTAAMAVGGYYQYMTLQLNAAEPAKKDPPPPVEGGVTPTSEQADPTAVKPVGLQPVK